MISLVDLSPHRPAHVSARGGFLFSTHHILLTTLYFPRRDQTLVRWDFYSRHSCAIRN